MTNAGLFEGIGGFSLGAHRSGIETKWVCEINHLRKKLLRKNFPNANQYKDIRRPILLLIIIKMSLTTNEKTMIELAAKAILACATDEKRRRFKVESTDGRFYNIIYTNKHGVNRGCGFTRDIKDEDVVDKTNALEHLDNVFKELDNILNPKLSRL